MEPSLKLRGAQFPIAEIGLLQRDVELRGVGNIAGAILQGSKTRSMISMNGTLGHTIGRIQGLPTSVDKNSSLIMHSDGLATRWNFDQLPGLAVSSGTHCGSVYRDFAGSAMMSQYLSRVSSHGKPV